MERVSRTFKLRLSPAGMDMLIAAHCRLIHTTRQLLPWGTTLHTAVAHLETLPADHLVSGLERTMAAGLCGPEVHFLGAPTALNEIAARIVTRVAGAVPGTSPPALQQIYILALDTLVSADPGAQRLAYGRIAARNGSARPEPIEPCER